MKAFRMGEIGTGCPFPSPKISFQNLQFISRKSGQLNHDRHALPKPADSCPSGAPTWRASLVCSVGGSTRLFCVRSTAYPLDCTKKIRYSVAIPSNQKD